MDDERSHRQRCRDTLAAAVRAEHEAYHVMRALVPELALPLAERPQLTRRQQGAVDDYDHARERLRRVRADVPSSEMSEISL